MEITEESFLNDVKDHKLRVLFDNNMHRHITLARPGSSDMSFEIVTWPGSLCYTGDMGTFVFSRLPDMFVFFRKQNINLGYWHEKLEAADRRDGSTEYSPEKFRKVIKDIIDNEDDEDGPIDRLRADVEEEILRLAETSEFEVRQAVDNYEFEGFKFVDFWECNLTEYTGRYIWACYAIVWAIEQYELYTKENDR